MKKVLLLEEDAEARGALARILRTRGFTVVQAAGDRAASAILKSGIYIDLIVASATEKNRIELLSDVRMLRPQLPVIFLSDYCEPESRLRGMAFGAFAMSRALNFYINLRPIALNELDRLIRIALGRRPVAPASILAAA